MESTHDTKYQRQCHPMTLRHWPPPKPQNKEVASKGSGRLRRSIVCVHLHPKSASYIGYSHMRPQSDTQPEWSELRPSICVLNRTHSHNGPNYGHLRSKSDTAPWVWIQSPHVTWHIGWNAVLCISFWGRLQPRTHTGLITLGSATGHSCAS